jgi:DNA-binding SARP family transcriptional activator/tetratricopeptide (TPR) repeat protein
MGVRVVSLGLALLGGFEIALHRNTAALPKKARALLAYLCLSDRPQSRDKLAGLLWPDDSESQARMSLRSALAALRRSLGKESRHLILADTEFIAIAREGLSVDVWEFESLASRESTDDWRRALTLYRGELLEGVRFDAWGFEQWRETERTRLHKLAARVATSLLRNLEQWGLHDEASVVASRLLELEPLREDVHRALMRIHAARGHPTFALKQFQVCQTMLRRELGVTPEPKTEELYRAILQRRRTASESASGESTALGSRSGITDHGMDEIPPVPSQPMLRPAAVLLIGMDQRDEGPTEEVAQEHSHALRARYLDTIEATLERFGGVLAGRNNGLVTAVFGVDIAHSNDTERALHTAIALRESLQTLIRDHKGHLVVRFALCSGQLLVSGWENTLSITGEPYQVACALIAAAAPGQILISETVRDALPIMPDACLIACRDAGVAGWTLSDYQPGIAITSPPLCGRRDVLRQLRSIVTNTSVAKMAHIILIRGEAGIGKSRVVSKLGDLAHGRALSAHMACILDFGGELNRDPIRQLIQSLLGIANDSSVQQRLGAIERSIQTGFLETDQRVFFHALLDVPQPVQLKDAFEALNAQSRSHGRLNAVSKFLKSMSNDSPQLLIVEDIHWATGETMDQLARLAWAIRAAPIVMVLTTRPDNDPIDSAWRGVARASSFTVIELAPLSESEAEEMAHHYSCPDSEFVQSCVKRAEGNPLFLDQMLRSPRDATVPSSIQSVVLSRVDKLASADRAALQAASIEGQEFTLDLVRHLLDDHEYSCGELLRQALIRREGTKLVFAHALIQEAVYASMLRSRKLQLHQRCARWFAGRDIERQAEHLALASDPSAAETFLQAAREFRDRDNTIGALRLAERGLAVALGAKIGKSLSTERARLLLEVGRTQEAELAYRELLEHAADDKSRHRALIGVASALRVLDRHREALASIGEAEELSLNLDDTERAELLILRGNLHFPLGESAQCLAAHEKARTYASRAGSPRLEATALGCLGDAYYLLGKFTTAHRHFEQAVALARTHALPQVEAANLMMLGVSHIFNLKLAQALHIADECLRLSRSIGAMRTETLAVGTLTDINLLAKNFSAARSNAERGLQLARLLGAARFESDNLMQLGLALHGLGDSSEAEELLTCALRISEAYCSAYNGPWVCAAAATVARSPKLRRQHLDRGEALLSGPCVYQNYLYFYKYAIDVALNLSDWERVQRYADALEACTRQEPILWSNFFSRRGRTLARLAQGDRSTKLTDDMDALDALAKESGINSPELNRAANFSGEKRGGIVLKQ